MTSLQGVGPNTDFLRQMDDLARVLRDSQAQVMNLAEKLIKTEVQQKVQDSSVGANLDVTA